LFEGGAAAKAKAKARMPMRGQVHTLGEEGRGGEGPGGTDGAPIIAG